MNRFVYKQAITLLGRLIQEYDIDIYDKRFGEFERDLLRTARDEATFYGTTYKSLGEASLQEGGSPKSKRKAAGV